ncbi:SdpI family protein [Clostridium boliviensis]|uniref:SdpI family protein n=1 Tax=Clostridium boliviensis TaxID=318465 RepID=A0ABU4GGF9_9CLOT|nr:SdpI family protein [Clostridium boliviensis]MDW2796709.1 SdpI family protein [Clostridium boliviensis]
MMKNKRTIILTSVLCMLPEILSLILYKRLPEQIAVHWNSAGEIDGYLPKAMAAFGMPFVFLLINLFTNISLLYDPRREGQPKALRAIVNWLIPLTSLILIPATLFMSIGIKIPITSLTFSIVGIVFIVIGNYLPKSKRNYMMGVRIPWTFHDSDNWNKTNRIAGHMMVAGGFVILVSGYLQVNAVLHGVSLIFIITVLIVVIPFFYSFFLYKKERDKK